MTQEDRLSRLERWAFGNNGTPGAEKRLSMLEWQMSIGRGLVVLAFSAAVVALVSAGVTVLVTK